MDKRLRARGLRAVFSAIVLRDQLHVTREQLGEELDRLAINTAFLTYHRERLVAERAGARRSWVSAESSRVPFETPGPMTIDGPR